MEKYEVRKLGTVGYISTQDMRPYESPNNSISNMWNIRANNGSVEAAKGWSMYDTITEGDAPAARATLEAVTNGTFDADTDWDKIGGTTITGGVAVLDGDCTGNDIRQVGVFTAGTEYTLSMDINAPTIPVDAGGQVHIYLGDDNTGALIATVDISGGTSEGDPATSLPVYFTTTFTASVDGALYIENYVFDDNGECTEEVTVDNVSASYEGSTCYSVYAIDYNQTASSAWWLFYGNESIVSYHEDGQTNVTRASTPYTSEYPNDVWITDNFNGIPVATNGADVPQAQYDVVIDNKTQFIDMPTWDVNTRAKILIAYKNFLVAMNITESNAYPNMIWWSDEADPGTLPDNWDYNDPESKAGRTLLGTSTGSIVAAKRLRDSVFIYCENGTFRMDFTGGTFVFRFTEVFKNSGCFGPRCVQEFEGKHFVLTNNDVIVHDGHQLTTVGDSRINKILFSTMKPSTRNITYVTDYPHAKEMWLSFTDDTNNAYPNQIYAWNWEDNVWTIRGLPYNRHMMVLPSLGDATESGADWTYFDVCQADPDTTNCYVEDTEDDGSSLPNDGYTIDNYNVTDYSYDATSRSIGEFRMYGIGNTPSCQLYQMDLGYTYPDVSYDHTDTYIEMEDLNVTDDETVQMMYSIYIRANCDFPIDVSVGGTVTAEGGYTYADTKQFNALTDYKVPVKKRGRRHIVRMQPTEAASMRIEGYDLVFEQSGRR